MSDLNEVLIEGTLEDIFSILKIKGIKISYHQDDMGEDMVRLTPFLGFKDDEDKVLFENLKENFLIKKPKTTYMSFYYIQFYPSLLGFEKYNENG